MKKNILVKKTMSGFTLIELLVVITIIGILATIVVVNLNSARGRGQDTAIKEQMSQIRAQAALYYDDNFGYSKSGQTQAAISDGTCPTIGNSFFAETDMKRSIAALTRNAGVSPACYQTSGDAVSSSQYWSMTVKLRSSASGSGKWCVDSTGNSLEITTNPIATNNYQCQ